MRTFPIKFHKYFTACRAAVAAFEWDLKFFSPAIFTGT